MNFAPYEQPYLKALPIIFAIVPINKESNNFASICKRCYVEIIQNERVVIGDGNNCYGKANKSCDHIIDENSEFLVFKITETEKTLPIMYWNSKMYKNPTGPSFIFASEIYSIKEVFKCFCFLKLVYSQTENFHKNAKFLSNYNKLWILQIHH